MIILDKPQPDNTIKKTVAAEVLGSSAKKGNPIHFPSLGLTINSDGSVVESIPITPEPVVVTQPQ